MIKMKLKIIIIFVSISCNISAETIENNTINITNTPTDSKIDSTNFFVQQNANIEKKYLFNPYEKIISGVAAFLIGNIGYYTSSSSVLKVAYTGIQTVGIINISRSIYAANSPSLEKSFYNLMTNPTVESYSKKDLSINLLQIFAQEERAKRVALFYGSTFITAQYAINAFVYKSPGNLKNIYIFLGGVNALVAIYSAFYKGNYEKYYYGNSIDIKPFISTTLNFNSNSNSNSNNNLTTGIVLNTKF
ncbi:MAG: hypothetical protein HQK51_05230 [Oligoflexia bacterium]|nr:hypothetical protein [Oligoflexia bacterium]